MTKTLLSALLAFLTLAATIPPSYAVTRDEIDTLITQANGLQDEQAALDQQITAYSSGIAEALEQKAALDAEIAVISSCSARKSSITCWSARIISLTKSSRVRKSAKLVAWKRIIQ